MTNRSNHPQSDPSDRDAERSLGNGHGGVEEDPLVELARIVSEGNDQFRPVARAEPQFEPPQPAERPAEAEPDYPVADPYAADPYSVDPYASDAHAAGSRAVPAGAGEAGGYEVRGPDLHETSQPGSDWDVQSPVAAPQDPYARDAYASEFDALEPHAADPQAADPYADARGGDAYGDDGASGYAQPEYGEDWSGDAWSAPGAGPAEAYLPAVEGPASGEWGYDAPAGDAPADDVHGDDDPLAPGALEASLAGVWQEPARAPAVDERAPVEPSFADDAARVAASGRQGLTDDLTASLEDELLQALNVPRAPEPAAAPADDWDLRPAEDDGGFDDLLMAPEERASAVRQEQAAPAHAATVDTRHDEPRFDEPLYEDPRYDEPRYDEPRYEDPQEAPPPPGGYDLDAVARAMREGDPKLGGHGVLPPHSEEEIAAAPEEKSRKGLYAAAAVLGVVVVGGGAFALLDFGGDAPIGPPPVITADTAPMKEFPDGEARSDSGQSKLIYDRVGGVETEREERLVLPDDTPVASLPPAPVSGAGTGADGSAAPGGPRRVRTVVVRPDGTIIAGDEPVASPSQPAPSAPAAPAATPEGPRTVRTTPITPDTGAQTEPARVTTTEQPAPQPAADAPTPAGEAPGNVPRTKPENIAAIAEAASPPPTINRPAAAAPRTGTAPLDLTAQAGQPAAAAPRTPRTGTIPSGTYVVQVSSQRSEAQAQAAFANLQSRYSGVLGGVTPVIQRADLGDRGTFYRVRIPAGSRGKANDLCERLKSAGGDCFVRRN